MTTPTCPQDYVCSFTPVHPRTIVHTIGPWWHGTGGWVVAVVAVICLGILLWLVGAAIGGALEDRHDRIEREQERENKLEIEKERTMQLDMAKGNTDILKILKEQG